MANIQGLFRIGRDAELRYTPGGDAVINLALAYNYGKKADNTSQWVDASLWGKRAESLAGYLVKGQQVFAVISDPHIETFQKRDGGEGYKLVGRVMDIEFAGSRPAAQQANQPPAQQPAPSQRQPQRPAPNQYAQATGGGMADFDEPDIPF